MVTGSSCGGIAHQRKGVNMSGFETGFIGGFALLLMLIVGLVFVLYLVPIPLWIAAWASGAYVGLFTLIGMRLRRVPPGTVITARISSVKAGLDIPLNDLEAHFLAGGNVVRVVNAMISADKANIARSEERRVGKEGRARWSTRQETRSGGEAR